jgi:hypothetical protein
MQAIAEGPHGPLMPSGVEIPETDYAKLTMLVGIVGYLGAPPRKPSPMIAWKCREPDICFQAMLDGFC